MTTMMLLPETETALRLGSVRRHMAESGIDSMLVSDYANIYYLTGRVFTGYILITADDCRYFVKRPSEGWGDQPGVTHIRKPEDMARYTDGILAAGSRLGMEMKLTSYATIERLKAVFAATEAVDGSGVMAAARAVKTDAEIDQIRMSGVKQTHVYSRIHHLFHEGMTDIELQVAIENVARLDGSIGQFRVSGDTMEIYMGNLLAGPNADIPTPYDFAMGGEGISPSLPVGANGTILAPGMSVMVDMNGNFTGYMTDMTRVYSVGELDPLARKAHECSREICREFERMARPGTPARELYEMARNKAVEAGLEEYFMGHRQKAGFVGHGVGIEINELPVIAPRSRDVLAEGNVVALEPKFVIPHVGAVGVENTYVVRRDSVECLTTAPEEIYDFL